MSRTRLLVLAVVIMLALTPLAALAQDDQQYEDYVSEDELLTMSIPEGWVTYVDEESPFPMVALLNSEEAVTRFDEDEDPISGDKAVIVAVLPSDFLAFMDVTLTDETTATEVVEMVSELFFAPEPDADGNIAEEDMVEFGDAEEVDLGDGRIVGVVPVIEFDSEGTFTTFLPGDGLLVIVYSAAFTGEFTDEQIAIGETVAASVNYDGTGDDLLMAMMSAGMEDDGGTSGDTATGDLDGAALIDTRCSTCHTTDRIYTADKDEAGWTATVDRMIGYGAALNDAEREVVLQYLVENQ